jgi:hypothetical protein
MSLVDLVALLYGIPSGRTTQAIPHVKPRSVPPLSALLIPTSNTAPSTLA